MIGLPPPGILFAAIVFGLIGSAAFLYGRKQGRPRVLILGVALCLYPYFIGDQLWLMWLIGAALTAALFFWRDS